MRLGELRIDLRENRVLRPGLARWAGLGKLGQPEFQTLMPRVGGEQAVDDGGARARQPGDEDRSLDGHVGMLRVLLPRRLRHQPRHQCVAHEEPVHLATEFGQVGIPPERLKQDGQCLAVVVVVDTEIVESARLYRRSVQVVDGADIGACSHQALYSPQLTSSACPVIPLDKSLAMNRIAEATSSSVGSRFRSDPAAAAL